jgi:hypothetical protein
MTLPVILPAMNNQALELKIEELAKNLILESMRKLLDSSDSCPDHLMYMETILLELSLKSFPDVIETLMKGLIWQKEYS